MTASAEDDHAPESHAFGEELTPVAPSDEKLRLEDIEEVRFRITAELGHCELTVRSVLDLERGSVLQLSKQAGEMADVYVNDLPMAKGEVVVLGDTLHVRIAEIRGASEKELGGG